MRRSNVHSPATTSHTEMDSLKLQSRSNPARLNLLSRVSSPNPKSTRGNFWIFIAVAVALAVFFYLLAVTKGSGFSLRFNQDKKKGFGIIIDGGSTGSRIHVFEFSKEGGVPVFNFQNEGSMSTKINPGLSSFSADPDGSGRCLLELLEFAKGKIPKDSWGETEIRLMATAGLRRLDLEVQRRILESCRRVLRSSGFRFQDDWASVITGPDEGIYAWVAANYALGTLGGDPRETTGIIELGGASAQVTFVSSEPLPPEFSHTVKFGGITYNLYSHSFLHFGQNVAYDNMHGVLMSRGSKSSLKSVGRGIFLDPCTPRGYSHGSESMKLSTSLLDASNEYLPSIHAAGNFSECRAVALRLLQKGKDECLYQHCHIGSSFIPELQGKFLATENFFYTSKFFGLAPRAFLSDLMVAGQKFCEEEWSKLKKKYHTLDEEDLLRYCFSSAYIVALLHDSLGIAMDDERIGFANQVGHVPLDWPLGAFILQKTLDSERSDWLAHVIVDDSLTLFSLFIVSATLVFTAWSISKWRKPQTKTIYDLEKGRYIITRVSR